MGVLLMGEPPELLVSLYNHPKNKDPSPPIYLEHYSVTSSMLLERDP